jgi:acylphosphatase
VLGWVRNVGTNTVETVAEGTPSQLEQFVEMVKKGPTASKIEEARVEYEPSTGQLTGFVVKRSV